MDKNLTHNTASYVLVISHEEIEKSDGYLEYHTCGYPIYWAYNIKPDDGVSEYEYWEPVDIVIGLWTKKSVRVNHSRTTI